MRKKIKELREKEKGSAAMYSVEEEQRKMKTPIIERFQAYIKRVTLELEMSSEKAKKDAEEYKSKLKLESAKKLALQTAQHVDVKLYGELQELNAKAREFADVKCKYVVENTMQEYKKQLKQNIPEPKILLYNVPISIQCKPEVKIPDLGIKPYDTFAQVKEYIVKQFQDLDNPVIRWEADFLVIDPSNPKKPSFVVKLGEEETPFFKVDIKKGITVEVRGKVVCDSDIPKPCMTLEFKVEDKIPYNFYQCDSCGKSWICEPCIRQCHKGHKTRVFVKKHVPSYSCCKCAKDGCTLANKYNPSSVPS